MSWYFLSLGSNLQPEQHIAQAITDLAQTYGPLLLLPIVRTRPMHMASSNPFLNTLVVIHSQLDAQTLKSKFNAMEEAAGRDRSDINRSIKDRPLDIDILAQHSQLSLAPFYANDEPYCLASLNALQDAKQAVSLPLTAQVSAGHCPATIHPENSSSHIFVIEDTVDRLLQRLKTTFLC